MQKTNDPPVLISVAQNVDRKNWFTPKNTSGRNEIAFYRNKQQYRITQNYHQHRYCKHLHWTIVQNSRLDAVETPFHNSNHNHIIDELSLQIEILKQDKSKINLRLTGLHQCAINDPDETIIRIAEKLSIDIIPTEYTIYVDREKSSIIVCFETYALQRIMMDAMRKKILFVEEIYEQVVMSDMYYYYYYYYFAPYSVPSPEVVYYWN